MPESGTYGSVRGAAGNSRPYRECRPARAVRHPPAAGVRKPPRNEPAEVMRGACRALRYGDLAEAEGASGSAQTCSRRLIAHSSDSGGSV
jgi:hypothetical protein